jgi:hypothetical protein
LIREEDANKFAPANRRPASPLNARRRFGNASYAPPPLSAAVAELGARDLNTSIKDKYDDD